MRLPALALVTRTLRVEMRSPRPGGLRMLMVMLLIVALIYTNYIERWFGAPGQMLFGWLVFIDFFLITFIGITLFPVVITEEKESMTLGLLRLAGFNPISILAGKSAGQLISALLLLGAQVPFAVLCITLGGVSTHQVFAAFAMLFAYLLFVFSLALLCSVICLRSSTAVRAALFSLLAFLVGPFIIGGLLYGSAPGIVNYCMNCSVWIGLESVLTTGYSRPIWNEITGFHVVWTLALSLASVLLFERINRKEWSATQGGGLWGRMLARQTRPRPGQDAAALTWKDYHFQGGGVVMLVARLIAYTLLWILVAAIGRDSRILAVTMMFCSPLLLVLDGAFLASRLIKSEVKWRTLPALMLTPIPLKAWYMGKVRGTAALLIPGIVSFVVAILVMLAQIPHARGEEVAMFLVFMLYTSSWIVLALAMAVHASLTLPRGGLALTLTAMILGNIAIYLMMMTCVRGSGDATAALLVVSVVLLLAAVGSQVRIYRKIVEVAGQ